MRRPENHPPLSAPISAARKTTHVTERDFWSSPLPVVEILGEPELEEIPDRIGKHACDDANSQNFAADERRSPATPSGGVGSLSVARVACDVRAFFGGDAGMLRGAAVEPEPRD